MTLVNWGQTKNIMIVCLLIFTIFFKCATIWKQNNCVLLSPPRPPYSFKDKKQLWCSLSWKKHISSCLLSIPFPYQNFVVLCLAITPAQRVTVLRLQPFSWCTHAFKTFIQLHFHIWGTIKHLFYDIPKNQAKLILKEGRSSVTDSLTTKWEGKGFSPGGLKRGVVSGQVKDRDHS